MSFPFRLLTDEFQDTLIGGRVQDVIDVDKLSIGLEIYANGKRHYLYMSADPNQPRIHLIEGKLRRGLMKPRQLGLLCRRFVGKRPRNSCQSAGLGTADTCSILHRSRRRSCPGD